jgi:uncharacterized membrane protein (UPF0136 family)
MDKFSKLISLIYGVMLILGGVMGFLKAHSKMSLITGAVSGLIVLLSCKINSKSSYLYVSAISLVLAGFFSYRFAHSHAFMPAGLMLILSTTTFCIVSLSWFKSKNKK